MFCLVILPVKHTAGSQHRLHLSSRFTPQFCTGSRRHQAGFVMFRLAHHLKPVALKFDCEPLQDFGGRLVPTCNLRLSPSSHNVHSEVPLPSLQQTWKYLINFAVNPWFLEGSLTYILRGPVFAEEKRTSHAVSSSCRWSRWIAFALLAWSQRATGPACNRHRWDLSVGGGKG